jgi:hypothetical protein
MHGPGGGMGRPPGWMPPVIRPGGQTACSHIAASLPHGAGSASASASISYEIGRSILTMNSPSRMLVKMMVPLLNQG